MGGRLSRSPISDRLTREPRRRGSQRIPTCMKMHYTDEEFTASAIQAVERIKPHKVIISTYGLYAGLTEGGVDTVKQYGERYRNGPRKVFDALTECDGVHILAGITKYFSCKGDIPCKDCEAKYLGQLIRLTIHA